MNPTETLSHRKVQDRFPILLMTLVFMSMLPVTMIVPVLKELIKDKLGSGNWEVALFTSLSMLGAFLFSPIAGMISDKLGDRKTIVALACLVDAVLFYGFTLVTDIGILLILRFVEGAVHIFVIGLLLASVSDRENHPQSRFFHLGKLMGIAGMFLSLGAAVGMPLGILAKIHPLFPFYLGSGIFFILSGVAYFYLEDCIHTTSNRFHIRDFIASLKLQPELCVPFAFHFIDRFTVGFLVSSFNIHMRETLHLSPGQAGAFLGLVLFPMSLLSYPSAILAKKKGIYPLVLGGSVVYGIFLMAVGWTNQPLVLASFLLLAGIGAGVMYVPSMILAGRLSPPGINATVMAAFTGFGSLGFLSGPLASVLLEEAFTGQLSTECVFPALSTVFGGLEVVLVLLVILLVRRKADLR